MEAVNQMGRWAIPAVVCGALLFATGGCETPAQPKPQAIAAGFEMPPTRTAAIALLGPQVKKFNDDISSFPGRTGADHRKTLVVALDDLTIILKLINGPDQSPMFTSSLSVIAESRKTADIQTIPRARMAAVENDALSAIESALNEMTTRYLLDKDQLPALQENLKSKVTSAAGSQGPIHDLDSTEAFQAIAAVVQQITSDLQGMVEPTPIPAPEAPVTPVTPARSNTVTPPPTVVPQTVPPTTVPPTTVPATTEPAPMPAPAPTVLKRADSLEITQL